MDNYRLKHSLSVARKMVEIAKENKMSMNEIQTCFVIGFNHDIRYEFIESNQDHGIIGGEILKQNGFKYWKEIYYHGKLQTEYNSKYLDILNQADMQIDKYGNDVGYEKRLEDIKNRYSEDSNVYKTCYQLVKKCTRN